MPIAGAITVATALMVTAVIIARMTIPIRIPTPIPIPGTGITPTVTPIAAIIVGEGLRLAEG